MRNSFKASRSDGRSDRRIICDLVKDAVPGTTFEFAQLEKALVEGTARCITRQIVGQAVRGANVWLLKEEKRLLHSVAGIGYRLALASEQRGLALLRREKADSQLARGVETLRHVRWDEMDAPSRVAHEGTMMILTGLYQAVHSLNERQGRLEKLVQTALSQKMA